MKNSNGPEVTGSRTGSHKRHLDTGGRIVGVTYLAEDTENNLASLWTLALALSPAMFPSMPVTGLHESNVPAHFHLIVSSTWGSGLTTGPLQDRSTSSPSEPVEVTWVRKGSW